MVCDYIPVEAVELCAKAMLPQVTCATTLARSESMVHLFVVSGALANLYTASLIALVDGCGTAERILCYIAKDFSS